MFRDRASYDGRCARDPERQTASITGQATSVEGTYPWSKALGIEGLNNGVLLNVSDLWHLPDSLDDGICEAARVALEMTVVHLADANGSIGEERVFLVSDLEEVEVVVHGGGVDVVLQHDDVRIVEHLVLVLSLEGVEGGEPKRRPLFRDIIRRR